MASSKELTEYINDFAWGVVIGTHHIGPYSLIEYHPNIYKNCSFTGKVDRKKSHFHLFVDGKDTATGYSCMDSALAGGIAHRHEGFNHQGDRYFMLAMQAQKKNFEP